MSKTVYETKEEAQSFADAKNAEPLPQGKEKRTPFKVYKVGHPSAGSKFTVAQTPMSALHAAAPELGFDVELASSDPLMPVDEYLSRLSPEKLAEVKKFLGHK